MREWEAVNWNLKKKGIIITEDKNILDDQWNKVFSIQKCRRNGLCHGPYTSFISLTLPFWIGKTWKARKPMRDLCLLTKELATTQAYQVNLDLLSHSYWRAHPTHGFGIQGKVKFLEAILHTVSIYSYETLCSILFWSQNWL